MEQREQQRSKIRLRGLVEALPDAVVALDDADRILLTSARARDLFGYRADELAHLPATQLFAEDSRAGVADFVAAAFANPNRRREGEFTAVKKGGVEFAAEVSVSVLDAAEGRAVIAVVRDVGRRRTLERALQESERVFRRIVETAKEGIWSTDSEARTVYVNQRMAEILGTTVEDMLGRSAYDFLVKEDQAAGEANWEARKEGNRESREFRLRRKDGKEIWVLTSSTPLYGPEGRFSGAFGMYTDITNRKRAEQALRANEDQLRVIMDAAPILIAYVDQTERYVRVNRAYEVWFGRSRAEVEGAHVRDVLGEAAYNLIRPYIAEALAGRTVVYDAEVPYRDGGPRWINAIYIPHREEGVVKGFVCAITDITGRKAVEDQIRQLNATLERRVEDRTERLHEALQEMDSFAYSVSHDLRAPLRAMHGLSDALLQDYGPQLDAVGKEYLERISQASGRMDLLIRDLLDYSRLSREEMPRQPLDPEEIVRSVVDLYSRQGEIRLEGPFPPVVANFVALSQVMRNLLENAVKFVAPGVRPRVRVHAQRLDDHVRIWVEDNGIGIAREHQERIFQIFERLNRSEAYPGTGIGLAIVRKAIARMNGRVGVESEPGKGSRFWIELPAA